MSKTSELNYIEDPRSGIANILAGIGQVAPPVVQVYGKTFPLSMFSLVPETIVSTEGLDWRSPAVMISFVVDNNPKAVIYELQQRGYNIQGLNVTSYKQLLWTAFLKEKDLSWLGAIPFIKTAGNWTTVQYGRALVNKGWNIGGWIDDNIGTIGGVISAVAGVVPIISGVLGMFGGNSNSGSPAPAPTTPPNYGPVVPPVYGPAPPPKEPIMGLEPELFWGVAIIVMIIIALVLYLMMRRKS